MRTGTRLRMSLEAESRPIGPADALQGAVEERSMRRSQGVGQRRFIDGEAMVLAGDQHTARIDLEHRMIRTVMAELHFDGLRAAGEPEQLMPQANAKHRDVGLQEFGDRLDSVVAGLRIAR